MTLIKRASNAAVYLFVGAFMGAVVGVSIQMVTAWSSPTQSAPGGNVSAPLTTSAATQVKSGGLELGSLTLTSGSLLSGGGNLALGSNNGVFVTDLTSSSFKNVQANDYYIGAIGKWASELGGSSALAGCTVSMQCYPKCNDYAGICGNTGGVVTATVNSGQWSAFAGYNSPTNQADDQPSLCRIKMDCI